MKLYFKARISLLTLCMLSACASTPVTDDQVSCEGLSPCMIKNGIAVLSETPNTSELLQQAHIGAQNFQHYFGSAPVPSVIIPGGSVSQSLSESLNQAGFEVTLPWITEADSQKLKASAIRKQVLEQTQGLPEAQQEMIVQQALAKLGTQAGDSTLGDTQKGALTHELGHMWFMAAFKPELDSEISTSSHGYGGWAPDWLDETAAVLMENQTLTNSRRKAFAKIAKSDLYPLKTFLTMEHPSAGAAKALAERFSGDEQAGESRAIILTGDEAAEFLTQSKGSDPAIFYTQTRGFIDFIMSQTDDPLIFASLTQHLAAGGELTTWLMLVPDMPNSIDALDAQWDTWLKAREP